MFVVCFPGQDLLCCGCHHSHPFMSCQCLVTWMSPFFIDPRSRRIDSLNLSWKMILSSGIIESDKCVSDCVTPCMTSPHGGRLRFCHVLNWIDHLRLQMPVYVCILSIFETRWLGLSKGVCVCVCVCFTICFSVAVCPCVCESLSVGVVSWCACVCMSSSFFIL